MSEHNTTRRYDLSAREKAAYRRIYGEGDFRMVTMKPGKKEMDAKV